jgi:hypothetical protein
MASRRVRRLWESSVSADIVDAKYLMGNNETCSRNTFATPKISLCARSSYQGGVVEGFNRMAREHSEAVHWVN